MHARLQKETELLSTEIVTEERYSFLFPVFLRTRTRSYKTQISFGQCKADEACSQETNCPTDTSGSGYQGQSACISQNKPLAAPLRGSVACLTPDVLAN